MLSGLDLLKGTSAQPAQPTKITKTGLDLLQEITPAKEDTQVKSGLDLLGQSITTKPPTTAIPLDKSDIRPAQAYLKKFTKPPTNELEAARYQTGPFIRPQDTAPAMDTLGRLWNLAQHPYDVVKGSAMFASEIPGFMGGLASAVGQVPISILMGIGKGKTVLDWYNASAQNMATISGIWHRGVSAPLGKLLETPEKMGEELAQTMFGAGPETHKDESQLVGEIAMVPLTAASAPIHALADSPTFDNHLNVKGLLKFSADVAGLIAGGLVYSGGPAMFARDIDPIVKKADALDARGKAIDASGLDEVIKDAQRKVLEADKKQLGLEAAKVIKGLDLTKLTEDEEIARAGRLEYAKQKALAEPEVEVEEVPKPKVKLKKIEPKLEKIEPPELVTDLDLQTGLEEPPELSTHQSPFRDTPELTQQKKVMYEEHAKSVATNPQLMANKLLNDINRWLDGEELPVEDVRNNLSELAARADELRNDFRDSDSFERWRSSVSDAATWARKADRSKIEQTIAEPTMSPELKQLHEHKARTLGFEKAGGSFVEGYLKSMAKLAEKTDMEAAMDVYDALSMYKKGNINQASLKAEEVLGKLHKAEKERVSSETTLYSGLPVDEIAKFMKPMWKTIKGKVKKVTAYHATPMQFDKLDVKKGVTGAGGTLFFTSDPKGEAYPGERIRTIKAELKLKNTKEFDISKAENTEYQKQFDREVLEREGYDSTHYTLEDGTEIWEVLYNDQIKQLDSGVKLYSGLPIDEISKQAKKMSKHAVKSAREFKNSFKEKEFDFGHAVKQVKADSVRALWDQSETLLNMVKNKYPQEYERIVTRQRSAVTGIGYGKVLYGQAVKEIYGGKSKAEIDTINFYVLIKRFADIYKYRPETGYKHQPGYGPTEVSNAAAIIEMAQNMPSGVWEKIINKSSDMKEIFGNLTPEQIKGVVKAGEAYFEWSRSIIDDLVDIGIKTPEEGMLLKSHDFRKFKTILIKKLYDFKYNLQLKGDTIKVNNSGVLDLGAGSTKIIEPDSRVVLSEQMARAYGSIAHQRAMLEWKGLADRHSDNGFVSTKQQSGWSPIPYVADGVRKNLYFHPDVVKYLVTRSRDLSPRLATVIRALSFAPITRALAVGTSPIWSTFAGLPMDVMHSLWTARTWEADAKGIRPKATFPFYETKEGKFKKVYSPFAGISELQLGHDMKRTLGDVYSRGPLTTNLMKHGLVMNFLTQRQNRYMKGVKPPGDWAKTMDLLSYHGLSMELWVRVATADRVIRRDAKKLGITYEQTLKNDDIMYRAAHAGRDRMDYNQGGWLVKALDQSGMIFLNAAVLGARTFWRQAKDNPVDFWFRTAQIGLTATGITAAAWSLYPEEMKDQSKKGSRRDVTWPIAPNWLRVKDRDGNDVTFYGKMRMDPNAAIIYRFFEGLTRTYMYDKGLTNVEPDYRELVKSIKQLGPIDVKAPPHVQFWYDYITNYKWWQDRQMYKEMGGKTFDWPQSRHEGEFDERVSQMAKDVGKVTGMSPVRGGGAISNIIPSNNEFVWLTGKAYEQAFSDIPKEVRSQHWLITLAETPGFNKVVGITRHGQGRWKVKSDVEDKLELKRIVRNGKFDMLATRNAWYGVKNSKKLNKFMGEQEFDVYNDMVDTLEFMNDSVVKSLHHRNFWLSMKHSSIEGRAKIWAELLNEASEGEKKQLMSEVDQLGLVGGIVTPEFMDKVMELQGQVH